MLWIFKLSERIKIAKTEKNIGIKYLSTKIIDRLSEPDKCILIRYLKKQKIKTHKILI